MGTKLGAWRCVLSPESLRCAPTNRVALFSCVYSEQGSSPEDANLLFSPSIATHLKNDI